MTFDVPPLATSAWRAVARVLRSPVDAVSCALLPASCSLCGSPLPRLSPVPICDICWLEIPLYNGPACACCGDALDCPVMASVPGSELCRACRLAPPAFEKAVSYAIYQDTMREAIHALKYQRMRPASRRLGRMLAQAIAMLAEDAPQEMLVVPVPLHRSRKAERGFNQARVLAEHALKALHQTHPQWKLKLAPRALLRVRATESQANLTTRERQLNVRGAFSVSEPVFIRGRHVLLVDDILTTGSTVRAAARALKQAGALTVWVATLARTRRTAAAFQAPGSHSFTGQFSTPAARGNGAPHGELHPAIMPTSIQPS